MPLTAKAINVLGSPLVLKAPKLSPRKIEFGALIKNKRANQIKQEGIDLIEK
jgi:hypothetical protein